jgi:hypothetical protein
VVGVAAFFELFHGFQFFPVSKPHSHPPAAINASRGVVHSNIDRKSTNMKSLISLFILVVCTACAPQGLPTGEDSPTRIAAQPSLTTTKPVFTSVPAPTTTPTLVLSIPTSIFDAVIDKLVIGPQGQLYASGYGNGLQQLPQPQIAQWDGAKWIALDTGFQPEMDALVVDHAGQFYPEFFTDSQQGLSNAIMR